MTPHSPPDSSVRGISQTRISEWVAVSFSQARDWTWVSCIVGSFFTDWTTREALSTPLTHGKSLLNFLSHWRMLVMVHGSHPRRINSRYFGCLKSLLLQFLSSLVFLGLEITWVWVNSRSWWCTGKPGVLRSMGSQKVGHDWVTELKGFPRGTVTKSCLPIQERQEMQVQSLVQFRKRPWSRKWQPTPIFLPGKFHEQRSRRATNHKGITKNQTRLSTHTKAKVIIPT